MGLNIECHNMSKIFNVSEAASIAMHGVVLIAKAEEKLNVVRISELLNSSKHHVAKVMQRLVKVGMLKSNRGPSGGFSLNKDPQDVSLLMIYEAIEGKIDIEDCPMGYEECPFNKCLMDSIVNDMMLNFKNYLKGRTLDYYLKNGY